MDTIEVDREVIFDLAERIEELNDRIESLTLSSNPEFMESLRKSKEQIKKGELVEFDEL